MDSNTIRIPSLTLNSHQGRTLLRTPELTLPRGVTVAITGPSGAGKSLFLKTLFGWTSAPVPPVFKPEEGAMFMIQDPSQGLTPGLSLEGHFREVDPSPQWRERAEALLRDLDLDIPDLLKRNPGHFSGGERQRMMLALILMKQPQILVCDEPAASLDSENEARLWELLLRHQGQMTLIFVTHQINLIETHADRVWLFHQGDIAFNGTKQAFFQEDHQHAGHRRLIEAYRVQPTPEQEGPDAEEPVIEVKDLSLSYGERQIFHQFSWSAGAGEWWWLVGRSGSGKTSLARMIAGLTPPDSGRILLKSEVLDPALKKRDAQTRRRIQYVYQHGPKALNPALTLQDQLTRVYDRPQQLSQDLKALRMDEVNLKKKPANFSLGEIQRLNLLRAMAIQPDLLICDELLASLDLVLQVEIMAFINQRRLETGMTVLVVSHDEGLRRWRAGKVLNLESLREPEVADPGCEET